MIFNITTLASTTNALALANPILVLPLSLMKFLGQVSLVAFFVLFPNGRLIPRWMGLILLLVIINAFLSTFPSPMSHFETHWPGWLNLLVSLVLFGAFGAIIYSQIYRYRRLSTPVQRQQTKWIILGVAAAIGIALGVAAIEILIPPSVASNSLGAVILNATIWPLAFLLIPLSIGFSMLRYRLYDIDVLINRTLVYTTLTILLALVYVSLVIGLQSLVRLSVHRTGGSVPSRHCCFDPCDRGAVPTLAPSHPGDH